MNAARPKRLASDRQANVEEKKTKSVYMVS